jgi:tight adherence protein G
MKKMPTTSMMSKQSGNAAILFALMIPVLFGIFILASDGARALQSKARLDDALEAASLAVSVDDTNGERITRNYIEQYMPGTSSSATISVNPSTAVDSGGLPFIQYSVTATTTQNSWFPGNEAIKGFGDTFNTSGRSIAKRYQSEAVDVVFAADFSGSMYDEWKGGNHKKYEDLIAIIREVTNTLNEYNKNIGEDKPKNTAAFTAFNIYTNKETNYSLILHIPTSWCYVDEKIYTEERKFPNIGDFIRHPFTALIKFSDAILDVFTAQVDYEKTVKNIFNPKRCRETISSFYLVRPDFQDVLPTRDFDSLNMQVETFTPSHLGDTANYQGIIRAAQLADMGQNRRRLIIVLTDGRDTPNGLIKEFEFLVGQTGDHKHYLEELVKKRTIKDDNDNEIEQMGMCDSIRTKLNEKTVNNKNVETKIAVIGFDYDPNNNTGLRNCADSVSNAEKKEDIKNKILALINEEIGHLS